MLKQLTLILGIMATPVFASPEFILPTLFDVTGVAADDVLNVRIGPSSNAEIIGSFAPDTTQIEIISLDKRGAWGKVNFGEKAGWVSMNYLNYRTDVWLENALPAGFRCAGTEPFWSVEQQDDGMKFSSPEENIHYDQLEIFSSGFFRSPRRAFLAKGQTGMLWGAVVPEYCSDGMSDREYGLSIQLVHEGKAELRGQAYQGCCLIQPH